MNAGTTIGRLLAAAIVIATAGCATGPVDREVLAISATPETRVTLADFEAQQSMTGSHVEVPRSAQPKVPASRVEANVSTKDLAGDALTPGMRACAWRSPSPSICDPSSPTARSSST
jgi:hypothetical protein